MTENLARTINIILIFIICLVGGGIVGYIVGAPPAPDRTETAASANLNDVLGIEDTWIVDGLSCPADGCTRPLLNCDHLESRQVRDRVNSGLAAGKSGEAITADIIQRQGSKVFKLEGVTP